jgi:hypothetical protein
MSTSNGTTSTAAPSPNALPSYLDAANLGPWGIYLQQVDRVTPYLGHLSRWVETLKRPKRALIVDVPITWTTAPWPTTKATACSTTHRAARARAACAFTRT